MIPDGLWEVEGGAHEEEAVEVLGDVYLLEIAGSLFVLIALLECVEQFVEEGFSRFVEAIHDVESYIMFSVGVGPFGPIVNYRNACR